MFPAVSVSMLAGKANPPVRRLVRRWLGRLLLLFVGVSVVLVIAFRWLPPPLSSLMIQRYLQHAWEDPEPPALDYRWVPFGRISPYLALAVVAGEDQQFPAHGGFDWQALRQALTEQAGGGRLRGASTISQQVAKNLYLWPQRSLVRKGLEAWFTLLIELFWSKQRILEVYLNIVELGERTFGAEAASRRYFHKPAQHLTQEEAALLAAVLPNPLRYRADTPSRYVRWRQGWILKQMHQLGGIAYLENL